MAAPRPLPPFGLLADSVGNKAVSCRSVPKPDEWQLPYETNECCVPIPAIQLSPELPVSQTQVQRTGLLRSCHLRPHLAGQQRPVECSAFQSFKRQLRSESCLSTKASKSARADLGLPARIRRQCGGYVPFNRDGTYHLNKSGYWRLISHHQ